MEQKPPRQHGLWMALTTILTLTTQISEEIDTAQADAKTVDGLLHVYMPKPNNHASRREDF
jgi:hypothetical protein